MTLTGILKNILLVVASVIIWHTTIAAMQFIGYTIALGGMVYYSLGWEQIKVHSAGATTWIQETWNSPSLDESRLSPLVRRLLFIGLISLITLMLVVGFSYGGEADPATVAGAAAGSGTGDSQWLSYFGVGSSS